MSALSDAKEEVAATLLARRAASGGFRAGADETAESETNEATAWSVTALRVSGRATDAQRSGSAYLAGSQAEDGRLSTHPMHPGAYSPTSLAVLAWCGDDERRRERERAVEFLTVHSGTTFPRSGDSPLEMDTELAGWPWVDRTFSWVDPTSFAILALRSAAASDHPRVREGVRLLLDRQVESGGWNYGNARVFGAELRPAPDSTGVALSALAGLVSADEVARSLDLLEIDLERLRTPLSFSWLLLAASAWDRRPADEELAGACRTILERAARFGGYETAELALLLLALEADRGLLDAVSRAGAPASGTRSPR